MSEHRNTQKTEKHLFYRNYGKRMIDVILSGSACIILSPVLGTIAVLVRVKHGSPVLFSPTRPGKDEKIFHLYKFRTMSNAKDADGVLLPEKERITKFGKFLRASSLDELPELLNILKGDMSIVGPRPLPMKYLPYYSTDQRRRHSVRPGLTGLAQISGRNNLIWNKRFDKDLEYVDELSLLNDVKIVFKTAFKVFRGADVVVPGDTTFYQFDTYNVVETQKQPHEKKDGMTYREIGADFWMEDISSAEEMTYEMPAAEDAVMTFSGRAAIDLALQDILSDRKLKKVAVPSYCSFAILQSLIKRNISYDFYHVSYENGEFHYSIKDFRKYDAVLAMSYFGKSRDSLDGMIHEARAQGCTVIEDITHSLFSASGACPEADYYVCSLRKWLAMPAGGWLAKTKGMLSAKPERDGSEEAGKVISAMQEKADYIHGLSDEKENYLVQFTGFESDLVQLDSSLMPDEKSKEIFSHTDFEAMKAKRQANAKTLYEELQDVSCITSVYRKEELNDIVPLYYPVLVSCEKRDSLKKYLEERGIYCQITWPESVGAGQGIRRSELSLICDQRYGEEDMKAIAKAVREWAEGIPEETE